MAVKDHSLDQRIINAAKAEFMAHGFQKASLHKISQRAGITTGALYTRYKNKDALFCSLVRRALEEIAVHLAPMEALYLKARQDRSTEGFLQAIRTEEELYVDLMFRHYEECLLLFCKSAGSSLEAEMNRMMEEKAGRTVEFFKSFAKDAIDYHGIEIVMSEQFRYYRQILLRGYTKEEAVSCMKTVSLFFEAGWKAIFDRIL